MSPRTIINAISDLHYGIHSLDKIQKAANNIISQNPEILVLAGDIAVEQEKLHTCLSLFDDFRGLKVATLGNHDIWTNEDSNQKYLRATNILKKHEFQVVDEQPVIYQNSNRKIAFLGNIGWYDYSFLRKDILCDCQILNNPSGTDAEALDAAFLEQKVIFFGNKKTGDIGRLIWNDKHHAKWNQSDTALTESLAKKLDQDLSTVQESVDDIVVVMHHLPFDSLIARKPQDYAWELSNAYMGSKKFGKVINKYVPQGKIRSIICGHTHVRTQSKEGDISCYAVAFQPENPEPVKIKL